MMETRYNFKSVEERLVNFWKDLYRFDRLDKSRPTYAIDTPPPYPSGEFHVGNALNWCYFDFVARYKRMRGFNVHFPQGWDCHGLPTEVRVENILGKRKSEMSPQAFIRLSREYTEKWIEEMKKDVIRLGISIDWSLEYKTMDPDYWRKTQLSFILMYKKGLIYKSAHPIYWCPRCETAIAEAEVEYVSKPSKLYYVNFFKADDNSPVTIATTRPELISACVAVMINPNDNRYAHLINKKIRVPIYNYEVPVIADKDVDPNFGTGIVMVSTYGDKTDVKWQKRYSLPVREMINEHGIMKENSGLVKGLSVNDARKKMVEILKEHKLLVKTVDIESTVGTCWRCHTPIEILSRSQWFVRTMDLKDQILKCADKVKWVPEHAKKRLIDWVNSLDWDWVISRQRLFATPIPVWYCKKCGATIVAEPEWLPVDPRSEKPRIDKCPYCDSTEFIGESDVMDTWMDSSITCAVHAGWPDNFDQRLLPADLQPNGYDIIRTWDYYLMVRHVTLFGYAPYKTVLINGMVRGTDGRMMHKSYGNYVALREVLDKYGADAFRLWAATGATTGSDIRFRWEDVDFNWRFLTKLWNAARFIMLEAGTDVRFDKEPKLRLLDKWIISLMEELTSKVTESMENFDYMSASTAIRDFTWHIFCDDYLEAVKYRLKSDDDDDKYAAKYTLHEVLLRILLLLAPFAPYITDEIYSRFYSQTTGIKSIHLAKWSSVKVERIDKEAIIKGDVIIKVIKSMRRAKAKARIPLNASIPKAIIYTRTYKELLSNHMQDIQGTLKIQNLIITGDGNGEEKVEGYPEIEFTITKH
ncbi:MAG: valine--tRNA ligase [Thermoprotei archaeon]